MQHETFWSLVTNLPHLEFEVFLTVVQDLLIGALLVPFFKRRLKREHRDFDQAHGIDHGGVE